MLYVCPLRKDKSYVYTETCAVTSCMYFACNAKGGCLAQHNPHPTLEEVAYYRNIPLREATTLRTQGRANIVRTLVLYRYSNFCLTKQELVDNGTPDFEIAIAILRDTQRKKPFCVKPANIAPNIATLAAMFLEQNLASFAHGIQVKKKLTLRGLLCCSAAEIEAVVRGLCPHNLSLIKDKK